MNAISISLRIRKAVNSHPLISKYLRILGADAMIPVAYRGSGFVDFLQEGTSWGDVVKAMRDDEFYLDPTRMTLVCGTAGYDGTQFKGILANTYGIQINKTSRNSVLFQSNINNTRSDVAHLIRVLVQICREIEDRLRMGGANARAAFEARVKNLMQDVPDLPNFSRFHDAFRLDAGPGTSEGDMRSAFFGAYTQEDCEFLPLNSPELDKRLKAGPELISANFVIPYPPGFPIMVPGQVLTAETIGFMRKLDVKEIHGYEAAKGLKLLRPDVLATGKAARAA
jgi:arginine decarboxylase